LLGFAGRAIGLDTVRLGGPETSTLREDPIAVAAQVDPTTRLTFGKSIGPDLELTFSQSLRDGDAQTWIVEYLPRRGLELRLVSDDDDLWSYGFRHEVAFGGPPRPVQTAVTTRPEAPRVASVRVSGDLGLPEQQVQGALRMGQGDRFDFVEWQADRDRLEALYARNGYLTARITPERSEKRPPSAASTSGVASRIVEAMSESVKMSLMCLNVPWQSSSQRPFEETFSSNEQNDHALQHLHE
jgi:hypothetical protein